jgi:hypothetical protein
MGIISIAIVSTLTGMVLWAAGSIAIWNAFSAEIRPALSGSPAPAEVEVVEAPVRTDCDAIRSTEVASLEESQWFLTNCYTPDTDRTSQTTEAAAPPPTTGDRTDCDSIRGTPYRSLNERAFFLANCVTSPR